MLNKKNLLTRIYLISKIPASFSTLLGSLEKYAVARVQIYLKRESAADFFPLNLAKIFRAVFVEHLQTNASVKLFRSWARHSHPKVFYKKVFSANSWENLHSSLSFDKIVSYRPTRVLKKRLQQRCFRVTLGKNVPCFTKSAHLQVPR